MRPPHAFVLFYKILHFVSTTISDPAMEVRFDDTFLVDRSDPSGEAIAFPDAMVEPGPYKGELFKRCLRHRLVTVQKRIPKSKTGHYRPRNKKKLPSRIQRRMLLTNSR